MSTNVSSLNKNKNPSLNNIVGNDTSFRLAVVVDIILDDNHPFFGKNKTCNSVGSQPPPTIKYQQLPINYSNKVPDKADIDYSYIGRAKVRILQEEKQTADEKLPWAISLDNSIVQLPLINEQVLVVQIGDSYYYTKQFNRLNYLGTNGDFVTERSNNIDGDSAIPYLKPINKKSYVCHPNFVSQNLNGYFGNYFILNPYIRSIKKNEGDTVIESRFGQSIRFSGYDDNRDNDKGSYPSYLSSTLLKDSSDGGYGNPRITIRNRQRNIGQDKVQQLHPKLPPIPIITEKEKNYGGQIDEDINNDGTTVEINSGKTISNWKSTIYKSIFGDEEQSNFSGPTSFKFPILNRDQLIVNTDRLILSSRFAETFHFSKKRYSIVTDDELTLDANDQIVITTNNVACINAPQIFLGQYGETKEPALLGQTTVDWLYDLCQWLLNHVHTYHHTHEDSPDASPFITQKSLDQITLEQLRDTLNKNLSRRVFVTGGGYAPGSNGVKPVGSGTECKDPLKINTTNGNGVIGGFTGTNRGNDPAQLEFNF